MSNDIDFVSTGGSPWAIYVDGVEYQKDGKPFHPTAQHNALDELAIVKESNPGKSVEARQLNVIRAEQIPAVPALDIESGASVVLVCDDPRVVCTGSIKIEAPPEVTDVQFALAVAK